jgi:protein tyrosine/serine phosphatase
VYWVVPGRLCAGEYPLEQLDLLQAAGIDTFVDLTEDGEYGVPSYAGQIDGVEYVRFPIPDRSVPTHEQMTAILDYVDTALAEERTVYVHCLGGIGRTGMTVACHLIRGGASPADALASIAQWRGDGIRSPETDDQNAFVMNWSPVSDTKGV